MSQGQGKTLSDWENPSLCLHWSGSLSFWILNHWAFESWIEDPINCKTKSFLYALQSDKNPKQYGGQSGGTVAKRTLQHAGDIENEKLEKSIPAHFKETGSKKTNLVMTPVKVIRSRNPWIRLHYEREFINKHHFLESGINRMLWLCLVPACPW